MKINNKFLLIPAMTLMLLLHSVIRVDAQQQPMYSQYMFNMLNINPAYAGSREVGNITLLGRKQWVDFPGAPTTATLSYDVRNNNSNVGWGVQIYNDQLGIEKTTGLQGFYSYRVPFQGSSLSMGISFGAMNYRANYTETNPFQSGDPLLQQNISGMLPTAGFGILYSKDRWYVGLSTPALLKTKLNASGKADVLAAGADGHYFLTGGYVFDAGETVKLKPSLLLKSVSGAPVQADINLNAWFNDYFGAGISYRTEDSFLGMAELQVSPQFRIGYSYDYTISKLLNYNRGTHEIMLRYELGGKSGERIASPRYY